MTQIIAIGGLSDTPDRLALGRYILEQAGESRPAVCFLPTATGDSPDSIVEFYSAYARLECRASHLSLFGSIPSDLETFMLEHDVVYVGGGRTRNMLALWREWGMMEILQKALEKGVILAGASAGGACWFQQAISQVSGRLGVLDCLGFLRGSCCPHYSSQPERRSTFHQFVEQGNALPGYGIDDGAALHLVDGQVHRVVACQPGAMAYAVEKTSGKVTERAMEGENLLD